MSVTPIPPVVDPEYDVCLWPVDPACLTDGWNALDAATQHRCLALASATLRRLTGYRVSACPITVRPCKASCAEEYGTIYYGTTGWGAQWVPHIGLDGEWVNTCGCTTDCACGPMCEIELPGPITSIVSVDIGGVDYTSQMKVQGNKVVYTGTDPCPFPSCQNLAAAPGAENTFTITYYNSYRPDGTAAYAAGTLAMEFAKACSGKTCRLPKNTTSVTRQGVTVEIIAGSFPDGFTGIQEVDAFIGLWRDPKSPKQPPRVWSPGMRRPRIER